MNGKLQAFIDKADAHRRITFGDVRRLQRDILPDGLSSREEAELLIRLDGRVRRADEAWTDWLVASVVEFAVWGERPSGTVVGEAAVWLAALLSGSGPLTKAARRIVREVRLEADRVEEPLTSLAPEGGCAPEGESSAFVAPPQEALGLAA
jgi:hypothetical protein